MLPTDLCNGDTADRKKQSLSGQLVQVISSERDHGSIFSMLKSLPDPATSFPMKIDLIDYATCTCEDIDFEATVMIYNYGVACRSTKPATSSRMSFTLNNNDGQTTIDQMVDTKAHYLFSMAESLIFSMDAPYESQSFSSRGLLLRTMILQELVDSSMELSWPVEYSEYCIALRECHNMMQAHEQCLPIVDHYIAAAA